MNTGARRDSMVISSSPEKTFSTNEDEEYTLTIVNKGSDVRVFELSIVAPTDLDLSISEPVVVVPAGSSRTVKLTANSKVEGKYTFTVNVNSDKQVIDSKTFKANVKAGTGTAKTGTGVNTTVLLTVILAIVFVVLLVVLILLVTRKPERR